MLGSKVKSSASLDYVFLWMELASDYVCSFGGSFAFVTTNSVVQGTQVSIFWPHIFNKGLVINFAHRSFLWANNAAKNAGVSVVIVGIGKNASKKIIFDDGVKIETDFINAYLTTARLNIVRPSSSPISDVGMMNYGNLPGDGNYLSLTKDEARTLISEHPQSEGLIRPYFGAAEFLRGLNRFCLWIDDEDLALARSIKFISDRIDAVRETRVASKDSSYNSLASRPHQFRDRNLAYKHTIICPIVSSENREYFPISLLSGGVVLSNAVTALYDASLWNMSILASKMHLVWIATVCGKLKTDLRYSSTLGWNTFPVPDLAPEDKAALTQCAEDILLARAAHFPKTIADLYKPDDMPDDLRTAHERNDDTLERIYIGRRFKTDTERLETLFDLYTKMTSEPAKKAKPI